MHDAHSADAEPINTPPEPEPERVHLHMPVDVRSASLVLIALLASVFMLRWASANTVQIRNTGTGSCL